MPVILYKKRQPTAGQNGRQKFEKQKCKTNLGLNHIQIQVFLYMYYLFFSDYCVNYKKKHSNSFAVTLFFSKCYLEVQRSEPQDITAVHDTFKKLNYSIKYHLLAVLLEICNVNSLMLLIKHKIPQLQKFHLGQKCRCNCVMLASAKQHGKIGIATKSTKTSSLY